MTRDELTHASFFSGVGGTDLGLERAGWRTVSFSEVDPYACAVLAERWPGVPNLGDITALASGETGGDFHNPTYTMDDKAMLAADPMSDHQMMVVGPMPDSGPAASRAKTSPSPESAAASPGSAAFSPSHSSPLWSDTDLPPSSSRTYRDSSPVMAGATWRGSSVRWQNSGMAWRTGCSTLNTSECPAPTTGIHPRSASDPDDVDGRVAPSAPQRFYLSARAAAGILRRATKRGRELPAALMTALSASASSPARKQLRLLSHQYAA